MHYRVLGVESLRIQGPFKTETISCRKRLLNPTTVFFAVFAYGTKGHVTPPKSQTLVALGGGGELSASLIAGDGLNIQDAGGITVAFDVDQKNDQDDTVTTAAAAAEE